MRRFLSVLMILSVMLAAFAFVMALLLDVDAGSFQRWVLDVTGRVECSADVQFLSSVPSEEYRARIISDVEQINRYWQSTYPELFGEDYRRPCSVQEYNPPDFLYADECGLDTQAQALQNAFYCGRVDSIFWDGPSFFHPIYQEVGPAAVTIIIAHEFGHLVQDQSGVYLEQGINIEMQADCYAGAFLGWAIAQNYIAMNDIEDIIRIMAAFGEPRWAGRWTERTYGNAAQRNSAVRLGAREGPAGCLIDFEQRFGNPRRPMPGGPPSRPQGG